ncbi:MAG: VWA domain-containing protein [Planctomycetota bacterium]|nr:VWA domain-containing protein [Planctomycetota bacterium]
MRLLETEWLVWLWALPLLLALVVWGQSRRWTLLRRFIETPLVARMAPDRSVVRQVVKPMLLLAALGLIIVALARPAWNPQPREVTRTGRDVVFLVDVSRSMLATDLAPNRLERAKIAIRDALEVLEGDRIGLVAFAGSAVVKCPLTLDTAFFRMALEELDTESVARGGTNIGDAVRKVLNEIFDEDSKGYRDIVLITDGEDQESFPVEAARVAAEQGVRIIAIGLGDETRGTPIPVTDVDGRRTFLTYQGERVLSRLDAATLREMAAASEEGVYFNVATGNIALDEVYAELIARAERRELQTREAVQYDEQFQVFLLIALGIIGLESFIRERA